ncbi:uncharacterized protein V1516DRAFT_624878 [Lipomyces oligophaga]|uniref:uncharacterized protein n=1 Tax=Lipomyces oligophaga TaxID=45792 RepID=UPI0034CD8D41
MIVNLEWARRCLKEHKLIGNQPWIVRNESTTRSPVEVLKSFRDDFVGSGVINPGTELYDGSINAPEVVSTTIEQDVQPAPVAVTAKRPRGRPRKTESTTKQLATAKPKQTQKRSNSTSKSDTGSDEDSESTKPPGRRRKKSSEGVPEIDEVYLRPYSCDRPHPLDCINSQLASCFDRIRHLRDLQGDRIKVRAYSVALASIRSYPLKIKSADEVARLPGCGKKIVKLTQEFLDTGTIASELSKLETEDMRSIEIFNKIWGVGPHTAQKWVHQLGWKTLDDVRLKGVQILTATQRIGERYYDDFNTPLTRKQVEQIANDVKKKLVTTDPNAELVICGSYRRGSKEIGDVDIVISSRAPKDKRATQLKLLIQNLKQSGHLTEVLVQGSSGSGSSSARSASEKPGLFGGLQDVAMVVWGFKRAGKGTPRHARVDLIWADWEVIGATVVGWTGSVTFERDIRSKSKDLGLRFMSGGIYNEQTRELVDIHAETIDEAERRVFDLLGITYLPPELRNTR